MKPVLLLIPGMLNNAHVWDDVVACLRDAADLRVADVLHQSSIAAMADDAMALVADVPRQRGVVLVGFSMGGYVAADLLARAPQRWSAAVLVATSCLPETPEGAAGREKAIAAFESDFEATIQGVAKRGLAQPNLQLQERLCKMMRAVGAATAVRQTRAIRDRADHRAALSTLQLPVHVVCGQQDRITPPAWSQALADTVPGAVLHRIDNAGHMLPMEHPQALAGVLRQALSDRAAGT